MLYRSSIRSGHKLNLQRGGGGGEGEKEGERKEKKRPTVVGSLFPEGAVIKCFVIPPNSKIGKEKCEKNDVL